MKHYIRMYLNDGGGDGGGITLSDIDNNDITDPKNQVQDPADGGTPPADDEPKEGFDADGNLLPGYIQKEDGSVEKDPNYTEGDDSKKDDDPDNNDAASFWEDVDKLRGTALEVEYPEGVDPLSPEGVYHREKAVAQEAVNQFEQLLRKSDPRGYAYLLHRQDGGTDEDFFSEKTFSLPEYEAFKQNADLHQQVYKESLLAKGLDEDMVQVLVDKAIKDNKLFDLADAAYKATQKDHEKELARLDQLRKDADSKYNSAVNQLQISLSEAIREGKGMSIFIPDTDKERFQKFVQEFVEYDKPTGRMLIVQPIEGSLPKQLEALYLQYKKGDLSALIKRAVQKENTKRLKVAVDKSKGNDRNKGGSDTGKTDSNGYVPLSSI